MPIARVDPSMTAGLDADVVGADAAADRRDELVAQVTDHAGRIARELARLQGGDYGQREFDTDGGTWTLKYEGGDVDYLRFDGRGDDVYVVSTKQPPDPEALARAMADYDAFVEAFNEYVRSLDGVLDDTADELPAIESVDSVVEARERILSRMRETCDLMAEQLNRVEGNDYGTFSARVGSSRWELKWEENRASYLRVGGEGGVYLLSQYQPPAPKDLRAHADGFSGFVDAFNEHVSEISESLDTVEL
ncbi:hypothetical protein C475_04960 [Halosimplex carlsbadense 2-9-1]|uniref:Profilin fold domain-containing protein n=2 Tax=Halosimplex carlsbadense TaxID=171164 RepID=M0D0D1_9EURY|nr:hypothetical protein C475_04960 [Halosimplex carlsbadense 2-9-1]